MRGAKAGTPRTIAVAALGAVLTACGSASQGGSAADGGNDAGSRGDAGNVDASTAMDGRVDTGSGSTPDGSKTSDSGGGDGGAGCPGVPAPPAGTVGDVDFDAGAPASASYTAPGTTASVAIVSKGSTPIWEIDPDPWGLTSGSGTIGISYSGAGRITTTVSLTGLNSTAVNAYPFIFYGHDVFSTSDSILGQTAQFPAQVSAMTSLVFDTAYTITGGAGLTDVLFDEWLMPSPTYEGGTKGAVEVEILPYFSGTRCCTYVKAFSVPAIVNGQCTTLDFDEYENGTGPGTDVLFYPASGTGLTTGEVRFDALLILEEAAATSGVGTSWYVAGVDLGSELGQSATQSFKVTYTKLSIEQTPTQ
jgi:Glycosyl hydrolase family 12